MAQASVTSEEDGPKISPVSPISPEFISSSVTAHIINFYIEKVVYWKFFVLSLSECAIRFGEQILSFVDIINSAAV